MANTYCGKNCDDCVERDRLYCPGCDEGPAKGDCEIAACCREKGHQTCATCVYSTSCIKLQKKDGAPEARLQSQARQAEHQKVVRQRATELTTWLWVLFWLFIPNFISGLISNEHVVEWLPWLEIPGMILGVICLVVYGAALLKLAPVNHRFQRAAICCFVTTALNVVVYFIDAADMQNVALLLTAIALGVPLYGEYSEYMGYAEILSDVDQELSQKWDNLWKLFLTSLIGMPVALIIGVLSYVLGMLALIVVLVAVIAASILKLVYLYRTAVLFREIVQNDH